MNKKNTTIKQRQKEIKKRIATFKAKKKDYQGAWAKDVLCIREAHNNDWFNSYCDCYDLGYIVGYEKAKREMRNKK